MLGFDLFIIMFNKLLFNMLLACQISGNVPLCLSSTFLLLLTRFQKGGGGVPWPSEVPPDPLIK